jgi:hypothetical protein
MPDDDPKPLHDDEFGFADEPAERDRPDVADEPVPVPLPRRVKPKVRAVAAEQEEPEREVRVDEVWSRGQEWGSTLVLLGAIGLATLLLLYLAFAAGQFGLAFFLLCVGGIAFLVMSYPIVITLERPVRMTPEQAIRDYYAALSHHRPHFRRMWLLLSTTGRSSSKFGSFEGFVKCWRDWLQELRGDEASSWTPLHFEIEGVKAEKSAGKNVAKIDFVLRIFVRGRRDQAPLASIPQRQWTVRGPDGMWYLDDGAPPAAKDATPLKNRGIDT